MKNSNQPKSRELKFHLHGTDSSKKSERFEKIKEDIISNIKRTFANAIDIAHSIQDNAKKTYKEPELEDKILPDKKTREE